MRYFVVVLVLLCAARAQAVDINCANLQLAMHISAPQWRGICLDVSPDAYTALRNQDESSLERWNVIIKAMSRQSLDELARTVQLSGITVTTVGKEHKRFDCQHTYDIKDMTAVTIQTDGERIRVYMTSTSSLELPNGPNLVNHFVRREGFELEHEESDHRYKKLAD